MSEQGRKLDSMQSKRHSFIEAILNVTIGYLVAVMANYVVLPWWGFEVSVRDSMEIGVVFMLIALARSYILRRVFNRI